MSRISKTLISLILAVCLIFSSCTMAFAESGAAKASQKKTVIIVPGLLGSELFSAKNQVVDSTYFKKGYRFWVSECVSQFIDPDSRTDLSDLSDIQIKTIKRDLSLIACDKDGNSKVSVMPTNPILDCRNNPDKRNFGVANFYGELVKKIVSNIDENQYNVVFFSYDWRLSSAKVADLLGDFIDNNGYTDITFVTHSMGGNVCASYLSNAQNAKNVEKTITLGAPFLGSARALTAIDYGKFVDGFLGFMSSPILNPVIKSVAENCPSIYELLPPKQYFSYSGNGYINKPNPNICLPPINIETYDDTVKYILQKRSWPNGASNLLGRAQDFHDTLYKNGEFVLKDDNIKMYNIVGFDTNTIEQVSFLRTKKAWPSEVYKNGDGIVLVKSAVAGDALENKNNYYVRNVSHMDLAKRDFCIQMIIDFINGNTTQYNNDTRNIKRTRPSNDL